MAIFYIKNDKFRWEYNDIRIEFSTPCIQAYNEYVEISSMSQVLYFDYTVKFFKKSYSGWNDEKDEEIKKWKLVSQRNVYDFPCIEQLQFILQEIMKPLDKNDCQKIKYTNGDIAYQYTMETEGFVCEDVYKITKLFSDKKETKYSLYAGCTFDTQGDYESTGVNSNYLTEDDLSVLLECVNSFLDFSIICHNEKNLALRIAEINSLEFVEGKLYKYNICGYNVIYDEIEIIFSVGDMIDINADGYEYEFNKVVIDSIDKESLTILNSEKSYTIKFSEICNIFNEPTEEMLYFNCDEIKDDFKLLMNETIISDFKNLDIDTLFKKYGGAIISRTWMCRDEHNLPALVINNDDHENVYANVKNIITKIKEELLTF